MNEIWLPIIGYEGYYEISNLGRVKSLARYKNANRGGKYFKDESILKNCINNRGYVRLLLAKDGVSKSHKVSRLVAIHFISNPNNLPFVNHIDGNKTNDIYSNLEWCTQKENVQHAYDNYLKVGKLTFELANEIRQKYSSNEHTRTELAILYDVALSTINNVVNNKVWRIKNI